MAIDTFIAFVGVYDNAADAEADYDLVKDLHTKAGLIDAYDAAVVERRADGKVKITKKHETPTRVGGALGGGVGLATGLVVALFPFAAIGGGLLAATTGGGAVLGLLMLRRVVLRRPPVLRGGGRTVATAVAVFTGYPFFRGRRAAHSTWNDRSADVKVSLRVQRQV